MDSDDLGGMGYEVALNELVKQNKTKQYLQLSTFERIQINYFEVKVTTQMLPNISLIGLILITE